VKPDLTNPTTRTIDAAIAAFDTVAVFIAEDAAP
jgi:hypothetical protein